MIFSHTCRVLAYVGVAFSAFILLLAAKLLPESAPELVAQARFEFRTGITTLFASLVLGMLAEIGLALRKK